MKRRMLMFGWPGLMVALLALVSSGLAQQKQPVSAPDLLGQGIVLIGQGNPQAARALLAKIGKTDPNYGAAKCYDAICLYKLNDEKAFLRAVESPAVQGAAVSAAVREDLDLKQVGALFATRRFEDLLNKVDAFQTNHAGSTNLNALGEYRMAGLFERGMKKTYEACLIGDTNEYNAHWNVGKASLEQFLALCATNGKTSYRCLTNRVLKENVWVARMTLGDEQGVLNEIPGDDQADLERAGMLGIQLYQKLQPKEVDENLQRMRKFLNAFPQSGSGKRVKFDMASISFSRGEALSKAADADDQSGNVIKAANEHAQAHGYFEYTRSLEGQLAVDAAAGIEAADVFDRQDDLLNSYYLEHDFATLETVASTTAQGAAPGELTWMMGKLYLAIGQAAQPSPDLTGAAANLDKVLAVGFNGRPDHNLQVMNAAKWRIYVAQASGDNAKAAQLAQWVQGSSFTKNEKAAFLNKYSFLLAAQNSNSK